MAKNLVVLEYLFMFNPEETWDTLSGFEKDLARSFAEHGLEATIIKSIEGQQGKRVLLVQKKEELQPLGVKDMPGRKGK